MKGVIVIIGEDMAKQIVSWGRVDEVWIIERSKCQLFIPSRYNIPVKHVPELAPSVDLFRFKARLKDRDKWDGLVFLETYAPKFLCEMTEDAARAKLAELRQLAENGKIVLLVSYGKEEAMCHRSIICGLLQGRGVSCQSIPNDVPTDYSEYYKYYLQLWQQKMVKRREVQCLDPRGLRAMSSKW